MIPNTHTLFATAGNAINLLNNGGFTQYANRWVVRENTAEDRAAGSLDVVDLDLYHRGTIGFVSSEVNLLGMWEMAGVTCGITVAPTKADGTAITSIDGGNVLKISFMENGEFELIQTLVDPKRFEDAAISIAFTGTTIQGTPVVKLTCEVNGSDINVTTVSAASFGPYRRCGDYVTLPTEVSSVKIKIKIVGCVGEELGISGVCAVLGHKTKAIPFSSSIVDRALPSGIVFMVTGETCPTGYTDYSPEHRMALVSGTKSVQRFNGTPVREIGYDEHDHASGRVDNIRPATDNLAETTIPVTPNETKLVLAADFHRYPLGIPFDPYVGELPLTLLGPNHSHKLRSRMTHVPPTFPVKFCIKL